MPPHARITEFAIEQAQVWLGDDEDEAEERMSQLLDRFEAEQPALAAKVGKAMQRTNDEVAVALGYFLSLVVWRTFAESFPGRVALVGEDDIAGVDEALSLDEELRGADPLDPVDSDDVVAMEQPHAVRFVQEHIDAALEDFSEQGGEVDVDAVHASYRTVLLVLLSLSYAVAPPEGQGDNSNEIFA